MRAKVGGARLARRGRRALPVVLVLVWIQLTGCRPQVTRDDLATTGLAFLREAAQGNWHGAQEYAADSIPLLRARAVLEQEPAILAAVQTARAVERPGFIRADSAIVTLAFQYEERTEHLQLGFVRRDRRWLIYALWFPDRI